MKEVSSSIPSKSVPLTISVAKAAELTGLSRSTIYNLLGDGAFVAINSGSRTLIRTETLLAYLNNLPNARIASRHKPARGR